MRLIDFENAIQPKILQRGYDYFLDGHVKKIQRTRRGYYVEVQGKALYQVVVELGFNERITYSHCDCPYTKGPVCKHQTAAFYALREHVVKGGMVS